MDNLTQRRAEFIYDAARLQAIFNNAPVIPAPFLERDPAFKNQFYEVIDRQMGDMRSNSPEELHGGWLQAYIDMGWIYGETYDAEAKRHPDMVPFEQLGRREQDKDAVFVSLCHIARLYIHDEGDPDDQTIR